MAESLLGKWFYVCNCGRECKCGYRSEVPSDCPCGNAAVRRRVLVEDEHSFYVCETGEAVPASNDLGDEPFTCSNGRELQAFPKGWRNTERNFMYRGKQAKLIVNETGCEVTIEDRTFEAMKHVEGSAEGWMGYPCYLMFDTPELFVRALIDDWDIISDDDVLAPPVGHHHGAVDDQGAGHDHR